MRHFAPKFICDLVNDPELGPTPIGEPCFLCKELLVENDFGRFIPHLDEHTRSIKPYHEECWLRMIMGGFYHITRQCTCYGGKSVHVDPPGLTIRQAAKLAYWVYHQSNRFG